MELLQNMDIHTVLDLIVMAFSGLTAWNNSRMKLEIMGLKLWIIQNFHAKDGSEFGDVNGRRAGERRRSE